MGKSIWTSLILLIVCVGITRAGDEARLGTTAGSQLLIPIGARAVGMGGLLSDVSGAEAIYWNPAGIAKDPRNEVMFNNMSWLADINVNYISVVYNGGNLGTMGLHIKSLDFGDINETTEDFPDGTGNTYSPTFIVAGLTYGRLLTEHINMGVTLKYISESVLQTGANTLAIDMGVQYRFDNGVALGVVMKNVGGKMRYDGRNLERSFDIPGTSLQTDNGFFRGSALASDIPSTFSFGASYTAQFNEENSLMFTGTFTNQNDASDIGFGGLEYAFRNFFFLRAGYNVQLQNNDDNIFGAAAGVGLQYSMGDFKFIFDYAYRQLTDYFDDSNIFTIKLAF
jgi:hypothetical protein